MKKSLLDDRRTRKTKKLLTEALKDLIVEKGYDAITVQDIIDKANVGRSTFYTHYESKEALLLGNINFQAFLINVPTDDYANYPMGVNLTYLFNHLKENAHVGKAMAGSRARDVLFNQFVDLCTMQIFDFHKRQTVREEAGQEMLKYRATCAAGGIIRMLFKWMDDGAVLPVDEMIAYSRRILEFC